MDHLILELKFRLCLPKSADSGMVLLFTDKWKATHASYLYLGTSNVVIVTIKTILQAQEVIAEDSLHSRLAFASLCASVCNGSP